MTLPILLTTLPGAATSRDITGYRLAPGAVLVMSGPAGPALASPAGHGGQQTPPGWPKDRSGWWLRNAAAGLCVLAAAAAAVSFAAQYRMAESARHLPAVAALEAGIPDAAALGLHPGRVRAWVLEECPVAPAAAPPARLLRPARAGAGERCRGRRPRPPASWISSPNDTGCLPPSR